MSGGVPPRQPVVAVVGGYGTAITFEVPRVPAAGETLLAVSLQVGPGGKGSNQAIAASRLGARVALLTAVGADDFGTAARRLWQEERVDGTRVRTGDLSTMLGVIVLEPDGENRIVVGAGALGELDLGDVEGFESYIAQADVCVVSLEIPAAVAAHALTLARKAGTLALLNPAPPVPLPAAVVRAVDVLVPNRAEAEALTDSPPGTGPDLLADRLRSRCAGSIVITLGADGALIDDGTSRQRVPAPTAAAVVDTTGAGDAFTGALATALGRGTGLRAAAEVAVAAASLSVAARGVVPSLPRLSDLPESLRALLATAGPGPEDDRRHRQETQSPGPGRERGDQR
jgi:ribokinase